jgi:hypothetical protein
MCVNNIHTQVRHHRGVEEKEDEEPPERSLEAPQEEAADTSILHHYFVS